MTMRNKARVVIRASSTYDRGPGTIAAIIDDAQNIAASTYFNAPGEFHMTLPITHSQLGKCEPWRSHYAVEENVNGVWTQRYEGIISDFDANQDDVIVYGIDYYGLLGRVIDTRYVQGEPERSATDTPPGSKYISQYISTVIRHLLLYAYNKSGTPVPFITLGPTDEFPEKITIYTTFVGVAEMIDGLVESHRQGTGKRSRFWIERYSGQSYRYRLADDPGVDRPNLRLEYGGLVQGFQIIGFGDWANKAHGIGRTQTGYELFYQSAAVAGMDFSTAGYPAIETVQLYDNVTDQSDLVRRVKQRAMTASRIGKRIAIGLRSEVLSPFDGYSIADNVPVSIQRGSIDTTRWGDGYWAIYGVEWRVAQDGSTETTLVVSPKETAVAVNPDTLIDNEALPAPIETVRIADGAISTSKLADGSVTTPILADTAVTEGKVADEAISTPKFTPTAKAPLSGAADTADLATAVENATAEVFIDSTGLTVLNGKISLIDPAGASVLSPVGFEGSWLDFLVHGVYNATFVSVANQFSGGVSLVGSAATVADYKASLSVNLPYWVIQTNDFEITPLATFGGGGLGIGWDGFGAGTARATRLFQDVPVIPGETYAPSVDEEWTAFATTPVTRRISYQFRDSDHGALGTEAELNEITRTDISSLVSVLASVEAPSDARYCRLIYEVEASPDFAVDDEGGWRLNRVSLLKTVRAASVVASGVVAPGAADLYAEVALIDTSAITLTTAGTDYAIDASDFYAGCPANIAMAGRKKVVRGWAQVFATFDKLGECNISLLTNITPDNKSSARVAFTRQRVHSIGTWHALIVEATCVIDADDYIEFTAAVRHSDSSVSFQPYAHATETYVSRIGYQVIGYY